MSEFVPWLLEMPKNVIGVSNWLTTPFNIGELSVTPLACLGASMGAFLGVLLILKVKSLILA